MEPLHIAIVTTTVSRAGGGVFPIVLAHARNLDRMGHRVEIHGLDCDPKGLDRAEWNGLDLRLYAPGPMGYAPGLTSALFESEAQIVHAHGLWLAPTISVHRWQNRTGRPAILSVQGMLDPWALRNSALKKRVASALYQRRAVEAYTAIHCAPAEIEGVRAYDPASTLAVIPNGIDIPARSGFDQKIKETNERRSLLFLSRIHPKKGIGELIEALAIMKQKSPTRAQNWRLDIVGWDDGGHEPALQARARVLGLGSEDIAFHGSKFGADKARMLWDADAFILPSFSEGFPMAVLEAWSYALPTLITRECNIPDGFSNDVALEITNRPDELAEQLAAHLARNDLAVIGERARKYVEATYSWPEVTQQLEDVYRWALGQCDAPETVNFATWK